MKPSSVTGEPVPDETARVPLMSYTNPRKAEWQASDFIVGNPPFIGNKRMRVVLGDGYVEALRAAHDDVPDTSDYVMYWWNQAANLLRRGKARRFGFVTTNSITQIFNRKVLQEHLSAKGEAPLVFAIPDHPWADTATGANVRIAMTVVRRGEERGTLGLVVSEEKSGADEVAMRESTSTSGPHAWRCSSRVSSSTSTVTASSSSSSGASNDDCAIKVAATKQGQ